MKAVIMKDGTEKTVTDKHARRLLYYKEAELKEVNEDETSEDEIPEETPEVKEEKKTPANKKDKTKKETK